jgi:hypothetical protein
VRSIGLDCQFNAEDEGEEVKVRQARHRESLGLLENV